MNCIPSIFLADSAISTIAGEFGVTWPLLIAQIVNFLVVTFLLYRFAFKPLLKTVALRKETIADGLQYAEEMRLQLAQAHQESDSILKKAATEASECVQHARDEAKQYIESKTQEAAQKAESIIKRAEELIEQEKAQMREDLKSELAGLVVAATERVLQDQLTDQQKDTYLKRATASVVSS